MNFPSDAGDACTWSHPLMGQARSICYAYETHLEARCRVSFQARLFGAELMNVPIEGQADVDTCTWDGGSCDLCMWRDVTAKPPLQRSNATSNIYCLFSDRSGALADLNKLPGNHVSLLFREDRLA